MTLLLRLPENTKLSVSVGPSIQLIGFGSFRVGPSVKLFGFGLFRVVSVTNNELRHRPLRHNYDTKTHAQQTFHIHGRHFSLESSLHAAGPR
jgi:nucleoid DNA-binding protein